MTETTSSAGSNQSAALPGMSGNTLMVNFEHPGGWGAVSAHFDQQMSRLGYTETGMGSFAGMLPADAQQMMNGMRNYSKGGSKFDVVVQDFGALTSGSGVDAAALGIPGMGGFMLMVIEEK